ncbi:hypothetical protein JCM19992_02720 [Thermostilla marina]
MQQAREFPGVVFAEGSCQLLARVLGEDAEPLDPARVVAAEYTIERLQPADPFAAETVSGHDHVPLAPGDVLFDTLQVDARWELDAQGYNFRHAIPTAAGDPFPVPEADYRVTYRLTTVSGTPIILRFRLRAL